MLFANVCAGFFFLGSGERELFRFLASPWYLVHLGSVVGGGRWGHYLCYPWGVCWAAQKTASQMCYGFWFLSP